MRSSQRSMLVQKSICVSAGQGLDQRDGQGSLAVLQARYSGLGDAHASGDLNLGEVPLLAPAAELLADLDRVKQRAAVS